ncbi:unnamed protein product [Musa banksii]
MEEAIKVVHKILARVCLPDSVTFSAVVNGFCHTGKIDYSRKMQRHMQKNGCKPITVTYNFLAKWTLQNWILIRGTGNVEQE